MEPTPMSTVGRALRRRHWVVWLGLLAGCVAALAASSVRHPTYQATAVLALDETQVTNQGFDIAMQADQYLSQRYISMATSQPVLAAVCAREGHGCDPAALSRRVTATALRTTGLLGISVAASTPAEAARLANEVSQEVVARNKSEVDAYLGPQTRLLQGQLSQLDGQIADVQRSLQAAQAPGRPDSTVSNAIAPMLVQLQQLQTQYAATYAKLQDVQVLQTRLEGSLLVEQAATAPLAPSDPDPVRYLLVGAAGGLAAGFLFALLLERYRDRLHDGSDLAEATGTPVVVAISGREPALSAPYGFLAQGRVGQAGRAQVVLVAASAGEPVDEVGLAMAETVIEQHRRVLVVPAAPSARNGHTTCAPDEPPSSDIVVVPADGALDGSPPARPEAFDLTIRCLPGPFWLTPGAGPAILVATRGRTRIREARRTSQALQRAGIEPAAAILLAPDAVRRWQKRRAAAARGEAARSEAAG
jgi:capsular polysaccharide biosynthesis protein